MRISLPLALACSLWLGAGAALAADAKRSDRRQLPYVVESYYKVSWGHQQEFIDLFRKNHYPLLARQIEKGLVLRVEAVTPTLHGSEDARWDYRVAITFKNVAAAFSPELMPPDEIAKVYPDRAAYQREEQRRFEILDAHWDIVVEPVTLESATP
jgi:hypothetical protein